MSVTALTIQPKYPILDSVVVPDNIHKSWQKTVDLMAKLIGVPAGVIMRVHQEDIEVCIASSNKENVFTPSDKVKLGSGVYCEEVMTSRDLLHVPNALIDPVWRNNPIVGLKMISYLGVPLVWPTGEIFGTICILDSQENQYSNQYRDLLKEFQQSVQLSLKTIWENNQLTNMQKQLIDAKDKAETANKAKSLFLSNMSHELRTPLNAVLGFSRMLQREPSISSGAKEDLDAIAFSGEHLLNLINDVLDVSKIEAYRIEIEEEEMDLRQTIKDVSHLMRAKCIDKNLNFNVDLGDSVPNYICADKIKIRQILINLISNAVKYTESGGVVFQIWNEVDETLGQRLLFEIKDTGVGISEQDQLSIFKPFQQLKNRPAATEGTGLGLAITAKFVALMGGDISVHSLVKRGSSFRVSLPMQLTDGTNLRKNISNGARVLGLVPGLESPKVLIAEDQLHNRKLLKKLLSVSGFTVETAADGPQAILMAASFRPDFIWMDIRMPEVNGIDACREIMANSGSKPPIIVALTTSLQEGEHALALEAGCKDVLYKPYREQDIFSTMAEHLDLQYQYDDEHDGVTSPSKWLEPGEITVRLLEVEDDMIMAMKAGAEELDIEKTSALIEQLVDKELAESLNNLVENFEFEALLDLMEN